jgi:hypothetical protein
MQGVRPRHKAQTEPIANMVKKTAASGSCRVLGLNLIEFGQTKSGFGQIYETRYLDHPAIE